MIVACAECERLSKAKSMAWADLPLLAGNAIVWSWYCAMLRALESKVKVMITGYHEAALTFPMRMRLALSMTHVLKYYCACSEALRTTHNSCASAFIACCANMCAIPNTGSGNMSMAKCVEMLKRAWHLGINE